MNSKMLSVNQHFKRVPFGDFRDRVEAFGDLR